MTFCEVDTWIAVQMRMSKELIAYLKTQTMDYTLQPRTKNELDGSSSSSSDFESSEEVDSDSEDHSKCYKQTSVHNQCIFKQ